MRTSAWEIKTTLSIIRYSLYDVPLLGGFERQIINKKINCIELKVCRPLVGTTQLGEKKFLLMRQKQAANYNQRMKVIDKNLLISSNAF
jgi:hypothetical protein